MSDAKTMPYKERPARVDKNVAIDLELLVEKVYRLMQEDMRLARMRRGQTSTGRYHGN